MIKDQNRLEKQLIDIEKILTNLPEGKLVCCRDVKHTKYYISDGHVKTYIPKENYSFVKKLAVKKYFILLKQDILKEIRAIDSYLKHYSIKDQNKNSKLENIGYSIKTSLCYKKSVEFLKENPQFSDEIALAYNSSIKSKDEKLILQSEEKINRWREELYARNTKNQEALIYKSISGNMVRSKSEYIIDMNLYMKGIPFRYEAELVLGDATFYPDFTILNPNTMQILYWEHLGMMDSPEYYKKTFSKLQVYCEHGIIPGINLIITSETKKDVLDMKYVDELINYHFC